MAQSRKPTLDRQRKRRVGTQITEKVRAGLEVATTSMPPAGLIINWQNSSVDMDAEIDADAATDESGPDDTPSPEQPPADDSDGVSESAASPGKNKCTGFLTLDDLIGSRSPTVVIRLIRAGSSVVPRLLVPTTPQTHDALTELQALLTHCLDPERGILSKVEWEELLGETPASLDTRLFQLTRLAVRGTTEIDIPNRWIFKPNDRVMGRYVGKFAMLPDGLPFSIRLLLQDGRGKDNDQERSSVRSFDQLPDALLLKVLRLALAHEAAGGQAAKDDQFADLLFQVMEELSLGVSKPSYNHVKLLRDKVKYHKLDQLFLNCRERQKQYDAARQAATSTGNSS